jgi:hypothetical protein
MNLIVQPGRQIQYLFMALLFASFAVVQSVQAEPNEDHLIGNVTEEDNAVPDVGTDTEEAGVGQAANDPNQRVIPINIKKSLQCAEGEVMLQGELVIRFEHVPNMGVVPKIVKLEKFRGTAVAPPKNGRRLEVNPKHLKFCLKEAPKDGKGEFDIRFVVTVPALPAGSPSHFLFNSRPIIYKFRDGKVTEFVLDAIPPIVRCCVHKDPARCLGHSCP